MRPAWVIFFGPCLQVGSSLVHLHPRGTSVHEQDAGSSPCLVPGPLGTHHSHCRFLIAQRTPSLCRREAPLSLLFFQEHQLATRDPESPPIVDKVDFSGLPLSFSYYT